MNTIVNYAGYYAGYKIINENNLNNFMYMTLTGMNEEDKIKYVDNMRLIMGNTFSLSFKWYVFNKFPNSELLKLF